MRLGVLSDAHGNLDAFEACLADMGEVDQIVFAGDLLGYYFDGPAILRRLRALDAICLAGNHDLYFLAHQGRALTVELTVPDADAYRKKYGPSLELAAADLTTEEVDWLAALPCDRTLELEGRRVRLVHGSPWRPADEYVYPDHPAFERFDALDADLVIMGHTHRPLVRRQGRCTLLNTGSCGQPRDGDPRPSYGIVDIGDGELRCEVRRVDYDRSRLVERCRALSPWAELPMTLLMRGSGLGAR